MLSNTAVQLGGWQTGDNIAAAFATPPTEFQLLLEFLEATTATPRALRRAESNRWAIKGPHGRVYAEPGGFQFLIERRMNVFAWAATKERLSFCELQRDGSDEGVLWLPRLPFKTEGAAIRSALGIRLARLSRVQRFEIAARLTGDSND
jgi:hypothetical protein